MTTYLSIVTIFTLCALITNSTENLHIVSPKTELTETQGDINFQLYAGDTQFAEHGYSSNAIDPNPHIIDTFITLHDIQGQWTNSNNNNIRVKDTKVFFNGNRKVHKIKESDDRFTLNGWILKKSSKTFTWKKQSTIEYPWYRSQTLTNLNSESEKRKRNALPEELKFEVDAKPKEKKKKGKVTNFNSESEKRKRNTLPEELKFEVDAKPKEKNKKEKAKYKGVYMHQAKNQYWIARFCEQGKIYRIGCHKTEEEAARAVNQKCKDLGIKEKNPEYLFDEKCVNNTKYKSKFKGLHLHVPKTIYWVAQVYVDKTTMLHLGYFRNEENAVRAANKKRMELGMQLLTESSTNDNSNLKNNLERENVTENMKTSKILDTKSMSAEICLDNIDSTKSTNFENGDDIQSNIENSERNQNVLFDERDNSYHSISEESSFEDEYFSHNEAILQAQIWRQKWEMMRTGLQE